VSLFGDIDLDRWVIVPTMVVERLTCDHCDETHGWVISLNWLCLSIGLESDPTHPADEEG
jgi:hypothetical protein